MHQASPKRGIKIQNCYSPISGTSWHYIIFSLICQLLLLYPMCPSTFPFSRQASINSAATTFLAHIIFFLHKHGIFMNCFQHYSSRSELPIRQNKYSVQVPKYLKDTESPNFSFFKKMKNGSQYNTLHFQSRAGH